MLTIVDHSRDSAGLRYVYPVVSRRAGGVSIGINLNVNNACNWACLYCQVENLTRGGPPAVDLACLKAELSGFLHQVLQGDYLEREVPVEARRLMDVAFSGNGEPTSSPEFAAAMACVGRGLDRFGLGGHLPVRLISNGSLMHRPAVQDGIRQLAALGGEVWFKVDRADPREVAEINGVPGGSAKLVRNLSICADLATTWVQTCWFALDGKSPSAASRQAYFDLLDSLNCKLAGVHLYGLARPSMQAAAPRLSRLPAAELAAFADEITKKTGLRVIVSP